jgi:hypothetical protein
MLVFFDMLLVIDNVDVCLPSMLNFSHNGAGLMLNQGMNYSPLG